MGVWSRSAEQIFPDCLSPETGLRWIDLGWSGKLPRRLRDKVRPCQSIGWLKIGLRWRNGAVGTVKVNIVDSEDAGHEWAIRRKIPRASRPKVARNIGIPADQGPLEYDCEASELISHKGSLAYPVRDGIPIMLPDETRNLGQ
jgi:uncharacterized protein YbaR (Trm112 family)